MSSLWRSIHRQTEWTTASESLLVPMPSETGDGAGSRSADTVERAFVFRARARKTGTHHLGDRLSVKYQWNVN